MGEVSQNSEPVEYNLVAFAVFDIGDKTNTARVVLIARTVQAVIKILISTVKHAKPLVFSPQSPTVRYPETPGNPRKIIVENRFRDGIRPKTALFGNATR
jgi:hypothetical protein